MVKIEQAEVYRECNVCHSKTDIYNITFYCEGTNCGTQVAICKACINKMIETCKIMGIVNIQ